MGLLDDYEIDMDQIETNSFDVPDDIYNFTLGDIDKYTTSDDRESIRFHYELTNDDEKTYKYAEWFNLPEDSANLTENDKIALSRLKTRIVSLGVPEAQAGSVGNDELVGAFGTLQLTSTKSKKNGKTYQNVRNLRVDPEWLAMEDEAPAPAPKPVAKATRTRRAAAPKSQVVAKAPESEEDSETYNVDADLDAKLAKLDSKKSTPAEPESVTDVKARIAAKRAARLAAANTSGTRVNPFEGDAE